jgi:LacI family transcriptional regulator
MVTMRDVAQQAGVSITTVSHVLNNTRPVSEDLRLRVESAMTRLGYVPNRTARSLRTQRSYTIAAIIPDICNPFYPAFARGIQDSAEAKGYNLVLFNSDGDPAKEAACLRAAQHSHVDGIVGVFFHLRVRDLAPLLEAHLPIVRFLPARSSTGDLPLDSLYLDNPAAAHSVVDFLVQRGHRHIAILTGDAGPGDARLQGFQQGMAAHRLASDAIIESRDFSETGGLAAVATLLTMQPRPTAVFAANDLLAIGLMQGVQAAGLRIPEDLAIVGFDDIPAARYVSPALTTVAQFQEHIGQRAAAMLLEHLQSKSPLPGRCVELPYRVQVRSSA